MKVPKARRRAGMVANDRQPFEMKWFFDADCSAQCALVTRRPAALAAAMHQKGAFCAGLRILTRVGACRSPGDHPPVQELSVFGS